MSWIMIGWCWHSHLALCLAAHEQISNLLFCKTIHQSNVLRCSVGTAFLWGSGTCQAPCFDLRQILCSVASGTPGGEAVSGAGLLTNIVSVLLTSQELWWCLLPYLTAVLPQRIIWYKSALHCLFRRANDYSR